MDQALKNKNQKVILLGGCIHMGQNLLLPEIMGNKDYVLPRGGLDSKGIAKTVLTWFLKNKKRQKTKRENLVRESFALKEKKERALSWTSYLDSCVNLADVSETFQGMHMKLKNYLQNNEKPEIVLIQLDIGDNHRGVTINHNSQKHVVNEIIEMLGTNKSKFTRETYNKAIEKIKTQEHNGKKWILKKTMRSLHMLVKLLDNEEIPFQFLRMDLSANLLEKHENKAHRQIIKHRYIDLTKIYQMYHNNEGTEKKNKKLSIQRDIANYVKMHLNLGRHGTQNG